MKKSKLQKNLKHGYIFLASAILLVFGLSLSTEIYLKGSFAFAQSGNDQGAVEVTNERKDDEEIFVEIQNLTDHFKTEEETITVVAFTNKGNKAWVNGEEATVNNDGVIESDIDLIIGENEILVVVENSITEKKQASLTVVREKGAKKQEKKDEKQDTSQADKSTKQPSPHPEPQPEPEPPPQPDPITGLKLHCSITNTQPFVGDTVSINCTVKDQNSKPVSGATGSVVVNWQSGSKTYSLPPSNGSGSMNISFVVPEGNPGHVGGSIRVSKSGLTVSSNFSLTVQ